MNFVEGIMIGVRVFNCDIVREIMVKIGFLVIMSVNFFG